MEIGLGIVGSLFPLLLIGGIIFLVVKLATNRDTATNEGAGVAIRRFFQYGVMLAMLILASLGIAGLIDSATSAASRVTRNSAGTALSIAFVFVGLPVFIGLAMYTARRIRTDPREQASAGWAIYLTVALVGSLVTAMSLAGGFLGILLDDRRVDRTLAIYTLTWALVWAGHWWVAQQRGSPRRLRVHLLLGSSAGLITTLTGITVATIFVLQQFYDRLFQASIVDAGLEGLGTALIILVIGGPVWWWYWFRHACRLERDGLWLTYVLLLGVLGGAIAVITGAGIMIFGILQWTLGDPSTSSGATHFAFIPGALGSIASGAVSWLYHGGLLGERTDRKRTEVDRVYDYILSGAGLIVAASGVAILITIVLSALADRGLTSLQSSDATAIALTLLIVGTPLWWKYWSTIQTSRKSTPEAELRSTTRRIYIFLLFGVAGIVSVINLIIIVFIVFNDILEGDFGSATLDGAAVPISLVLTAGVLAWYHSVIFREDREATHERERPTLHRAIVVGSDTGSIAQTIRADLGASVTSLSVTSDSASASSVENMLEILRSGDHEAVVVIAGEDGSYEVRPLDG